MAEQRRPEKNISDPIIIPGRGIYFHGRFFQRNPMDVALNEDGMRRPIRQFGVPDLPRLR